MKATNEILDVKEYALDGDEFIVICPHCGRPLGLERGPIKGEQFTDKVCGGAFDVTYDARRVKSVYKDC